MGKKKPPKGGRPRFDYGQILERLEDRNEALGRVYAQKKTAPPTPPTPPTATSPGPDEEPKKPAEPMLTGQGMLFDPGQPICPNPHCGALLDEASMQTGKCYVCDDYFDPTGLIIGKDEPLDDQPELPFD